MNYEKNKEFVKRFSKDVIVKLKQMMIRLIQNSIVEVFYLGVLRHRIYDNLGKDHLYFWPGDVCIERYGKKYTKQQITDIFFENVDKVEFDKFCEILKIDFNYIYDWYESFIYGCNYRITPRYILYEKDNKCFEKLLEDKYKIYFRDEKRRLRNIEKKNKKNKEKETLSIFASLDIPQDGLAENFYIHIPFEITYIKK